MRKFFSFLLIVIVMLVLVITPVSAAAPASGMDQTQVQQVVSAEENPLANMPAEALSLIVFTTGFVAVLKKFGVKGNWLTASSLLWGIGLGILYKVATHPPVTFADWFFAGLFGFLCGLVATGIYDAYGNKVVDSGMD